MKTAYIIGRFQPFHVGHLHLVQQAVKDGITNIVVLVGSANRAVSIKNPFTFAQRKRQIYSTIEASGLPTHTAVNLRVEPLNDYSYNDTMWIQQVSSLIENPQESCIYGHLKDESSGYLHWFPDVKFVNVPPLNYGVVTLNATEIRNKLFETILAYEEAPFSKAHSALISVARSFHVDNEQQLVMLAKEYQYIKKYKEQFNVLPYAPTFVTADAVVVQSGFILLVERGGFPGKGLLALPGGFLDAQYDRSALDAAIREVYEETSIKVPEKVLRASLTQSKVFDAIDRSVRGRTITHAHFFELDNSKPLPKAKGSDDAASAKWYKLSDLDPTKLFEDHWDIITHFAR